MELHWEEESQIRVSTDNTQTLISANKMGQRTGNACMHETNCVENIAFMLYNTIVYYID